MVLRCIFRKGPLSWAEPAASPHCRLSLPLSTSGNGTSEQPSVATRTRLQSSSRWTAFGSIWREVAMARCCWQDMHTCETHTFLGIKWMCFTFKYSDFLWKCESTIRLSTKYSIIQAKSTCGAHSWKWSPVLLYLNSPKVVRKFRKFNPVPNKTEAMLWRRNV